MTDQGSEVPEKTVRMAGAVQDITDQERAKKRLQLSEEKFYKAFQFSPDAVTLSSLTTGLFLEVNEGFTRILGHTADETIGKTQSELGIWLRQENRRRGVEQLQRDGVLRDYEAKLVHASGEPRDCLISAEIIDLEGKPFVIGVTRDVTERKQNERMLRLAQTSVDVAADLVFWIRRDGRFAYVNAASCRVLEYEMEELLSLGVPDVDQNYPQEKFDELWQELSQSKSRLIETEITMKSGRTLPVEMRLSFFEYAEEEYLLAFVRDITERVQAQKRREELEEQLTQTQKLEALGTLAGGIAHDFNNLLGAIYGYSELAANSLPKNSRAHSDLQEVLKATELATDLTRRILTFSRRTEPRRERILLLPIVKEALKLLRASIPATIEFRQNLTPHPVSIDGDSTQIHQVIMNLCTNAYHAMRETGGVLTVKVETRTVRGYRMLEAPNLGPGDYALITISDTGIGMDEETARRCFEPFYTTKKKGAGTGLGLSVVHGIIENHQGAITVKSTPQVGTAFSVCLPMAEAAPPVALGNQIELPKGSGRVLVVDDKPELASLADKMLTHLGYTVAVYTSSQEALDAFRQDPASFDLVLTDQTMPQMTGAELAQELLKLQPNLPIVITTGYSESLDEAKAIEAGVRALLYKPLRLNVLARTLHLALSER